MPTIKEIIEAILNEIKGILKESLNEAGTALKKRLKKLLIISIIVSVLLALIVSFVGSASLFILLGSLKYLVTLMPAWKAWYITGISSGVIGAVILLGLFLFIKKQLSSSQLPATSKPENKIVDITTVAKGAKIEKVDAEIDEISQRILLELQSASSSDLSDARYAKMMLRLSDAHYAKGVLQKLGSDTCGAEKELEKRAVIKVLLFSTWLQRLDFNKVFSYGAFKCCGYLSCNMVSWYHKSHWKHNTRHLCVRIFPSCNKAIRYSNNESYKKNR